MAMSPLLWCLLSGASALHVPLLDIYFPPSVSRHPAAAITPGPSPGALDLRLRAQTVTLDGCGASCITSAATKSTDCSADDDACQCAYSNLKLITPAASTCIASSCTMDGPQELRRLPVCSKLVPSSSTRNLPSISAANKSRSAQCSGTSFRMTAG